MRLPFFSKNRFRLQTDHHFLLLEQFDCATQSWQKRAETHCEYPTEKTLLAWFQGVPKLRYARLSLLLNADLFQFYSLDASPINGANSFSLQKLKAEITPLVPVEIDCDHTLFDLALVSGETQLVLIQKGRIQLVIATLSPFFRYQNLSRTFVR